MKQHTPRLILPCLLVALAGCSSLGGSDFASQSDAPLQALESWQQTLPDASQRTYLTDLMPSEQVQALIQRGLENNPGVRQTALAIQIARENITDAKGERLPHANLNLSHTKTEDTDAVYQSGVQVSWTLDWLQKLQDGVDISTATLTKQQAEDQYARDLLASSIMDTWLQLVQQSQLIEIERQRLRVLEQNETTIVERYRKGLDELTDLDSARSRSASSRATLSAYRESQQTLQRAMAVLLGETLGDTRYQPNTTLAYPGVEVPLASVPEQDLGRRPDLQQAYLDIRIADLNSAIAYKSLLPSLSMSLSLAQSSASFRESLFTSPVWSLLNQLTAPLFQGDKLRAQARQADLSAEQRYWAYQETLLTAVREVEDAIGQEKTLMQQQAHIQDALDNAERSFEVYQNKYRQGLVSFLDLLTIQTQTFDLQVQKTRLIYNRLSNRVSLGLALGLGVKS
ncbi:MAG: TolC family protein [Oceanobacter sp.]